MYTVGVDGVDVGDGTTIFLTSVISNVVMGCIVLGRQINVYFSISACNNTKLFVGMNGRFCTMKIHDSMISCKQTIHSIVVIVESINLTFVLEFSHVVWVAVVCRYYSKITDALVVGFTRVWLVMMLLLK